MSEDGFPGLPTSQDYEIARQWFAEENSYPQIRDRLVAERGLQIESARAIVDELAGAFPTFNNAGKLTIVVGILLAGGKALLFQMMLGNRGQPPRR